MEFYFILYKQKIRWETSWKLRFNSIIFIIYTFHTHIITLDFKNNKNVLSYYVYVISSWRRNNCPQTKFFCGYSLSLYTMYFMLIRRMLPHRKQINVVTFVCINVYSWMRAVKRKHFPFCQTLFCFTYKEKQLWAFPNPPQHPPHSLYIYYSLDRFHR